MTDKIFKTNLRKFCQKFDIRAADIVAGTSLSDSVVYEMYNPASSTTVTLDHATVVIKYLRQKTRSLVSLDYLLDDHQLSMYFDFTSRIGKHLRERAQHLDYYDDNLARLKSEQKEYIDYLDRMCALMKPLDL
tara:strand:- start:4898 stop:5296 length:399 start_codon:yes stop_codon:yes gene_type:complete